MTSAADRRRRAEVEPEDRPSAVWLAFVTASGAAAASFAVVAVLVLVGWGLSAPHGSATDALRLATQLWLLAHLGRLELDVGAVGVVPLGLTLLVATLLFRGGIGLARRAEFADARAAARGVVALSASYASVVVLTTGFADSPTLRVNPIRVLVGATLLAAVAGGAGVLRASPLGEWFSRWHLYAIGLALRFAAITTSLLVAAGAITAGASLAVHHGQAEQLSRTLAPAVVDGIGLTLLGLVLVPNAALWGAAYLTGAGFAVGAGTSVTPLAVTVGPVPAFPLIAAVPATAPTLAVWLLAVPLLAGLIGGVVVGTSGTVGQGVFAAVGGALLAGLALVALAWLAGGPVGVGRLAQFGPAPWRTGIAAAVEFGVSGAVVAGATRWWLERVVLR